jgi:mono/diheme cytochrome c family protein
MTEIPEHLLARSRARREAAGLATPADAGATTTPTPGGEVEVVAAAAVATPAAAAAPPPPPPPPKPDPPYIQAYRNRKKIPFWAMPALALLPLWAFIYANTLEKPPATQTGPLAEGAKIFQQCASCHGSTGEGGIGPSFQGGVLAKDWPKFQDQIRWVSLGSAGWPGDTYGAQNKPKKGGMPPWATQLTPLQIAEVVRYEREVLSGLPPDPDLVAITEGTKPPLDKDGNQVAAG